MRGHTVRAEAIVNAALDLAEKHSVAGVTTAALAEKLDFTEAALYRYFPGKDAIIAAALHHAGEHVFATMALELAPEGTRKGQNCEEQLVRHAKRFALRGGLLLELVLRAAATRDGALRAAGSEFVRTYGQRMAAYFGELRRCGLTASALSPEETARLWTCQLLGSFARSRVGRERWEPSSEPGFRVFVAELLTGRAVPAG